MFERRQGKERRWYANPENWSNVLLILLSISGLAR